MGFFFFFLLAIPYKNIISYNFTIYNPSITKNIISIIVPKAKNACLHISTIFSTIDYANSLFGKIFRTMKLVYIIYSFV